jgi:prolyl-tRNA synthetase
MFAEMELIGIPHRVVVGEKGLATGTVEYKGRRDGDAQQVPLADLLSFLNEKLSSG